jgi:hypothetical protein
MPYRVRTGGQIAYIAESGDEATVKDERRYDVLGKLGLLLIVAGTAAQVAAALVS